ncbi:MAG: hypothetical protein VR70_14685 [Rhodospirillaceae bacterium BRH_c57]|nr:MAG: hypothetical protein VR70_14685 [Rhodospirillaceae bacterium BRH_c57]
MSHWLPLSRVARLVGISRAALQEHIRSGALETFDGGVALDAVLRVFPDARLEDDSEFQRLEEIKRQAIWRPAHEETLPDRDVLASRLHRVGDEFAAAKVLLMHYDRVLGWLDVKLADLAERTPEADALRAWLADELAAAPPEADRGRTLLARETVMRVMSAHTRLEPSGHDFFVNGDDTVLEAALGAGVPVAYGCSNGTCGACRARLVSGEVRKVRPHDYTFSEADKAAGAFLMCCNTAVADSVVEASVEGCTSIPTQHIPAKVRAVEPLGDFMAALHLTTPRSQRLRFLSGQSVTLTAPDGSTADFPVASCPCEGREVTVHVRRDGGPFAAALDGLGRADTIVIDGPRGSLAFREDRARPVVFIGLDEGFAPLKSLIQHAMSLEFAEPMHLVWAAGAVGQYRDNLCRSWADAFDTFTYTPLAADNAQAAADAVVRAVDTPAGADVYAAGPAPFLEAVRAALVARGLPEDAWRA